MRRRTLRWVVATLALALAGAIAFLLLRPEPPARFTREMFDRIQAGMTRADVEALLGRPGDYTTGPVEAAPGFRSMVVLQKPPLTALVLDWRDNAGGISVAFDASGRPVAKSIGSCRRDHSPLRWLGWLRQRCFP